jgi:hypothetical protein
MVIEKEYVTETKKEDPKPQVIIENVGPSLEEINSLLAGVKVDIPDGPGK